MTYKKKGERERERERRRPSLHIFTFWNRRTTKCFIVFSSRMNEWMNVMLYCKWKHMKSNYFSCCTRISSRPTIACLVMKLKSYLIILNTFIFIYIYIYIYKCVRLRIGRLRVCVANAFLFSSWKGRRHLTHFIFSSARKQNANWKNAISKYTKTKTNWHSSTC